MTGYLAVEERLTRAVMDAKVVRGMSDRSDHYAVLAKIKIRGNWKFGRSNGREQGNMIMAKEKVNKEEVREEYKRSR